MLLLFWMYILFSKLIENDQVIQHDIPRYEKREATYNYFVPLC